MAKVRCECGASFECHLSHESNGQEASPGRKRQEVNKLLVAGTPRAGLGRAGVESLLAPLGINVPSQHMWAQLEGQLDDELKTVSEKLEEEALLEEIAKTTDVFIPKAGREAEFFGPGPVKRISFQCDCGWCKPSHGHTYASKGGVCAFVGSVTKGALSHQTLQTMCGKCNQRKKDTGDKRHDGKCFKNHTGGSPRLSFLNLLHAANNHYHPSLHTYTTMCRLNSKMLLPLPPGNLKLFYVAWRITMVRQRWCALQGAPNQWRRAGSNSCSDV